MSKLDGSKATPVGDIPVEMLKYTIDVHASFLTKIIKASIRNGCFPDGLKAAEGTPIFKKNDDLDKKYCIPISVLPHVSKIIEHFMGACLSSTDKIVLVNYTIFELLMSIFNNSLFSSSLKRLALKVF